MRSRTCATALAVALTIAACSPQPKTAVLPPAKTVPATVSTPSPVPLPGSSASVTTKTSVPAQPTTGEPTALVSTASPAAPTLTAGQAYSLTRRAYEAANIAFRTGDTTAYKAAVGKGCKCLALVQFMEGLKNKHEVLKGGLFTNLQVRDFFFNSVGSTVSAFYTGSAGKITSAAGKEVGVVYARMQSQDAVTLQYNGNVWYVADISSLSQGREIR